jgi:sarcosine oxidase
MAHRTYDVIIIGAGGMGSATAFELAHRGHRVLALEQFPLVHDRGSSHGQTRIIRTAYYEHPCYVPLVRRAFERWYQLEQRSGRHLLTESDCLSIGTPQSEVIRGVLQAAREHNLKTESLDSDELRQRFPMFRFGPEYVGVLEHQAGFLYVEDCVRTYIDEAIHRGATIRAEETVQSWQSTGNGVSVTTTRETYCAAKLVVTAGPWARQLLGQIGSPLRLMRQTLLWFGTSHAEQLQRNRFPIYLAEVPEGNFYGLPMIDPTGPKIARHYGASELLSPEEVSRELTAQDEEPIRQFLKKYLPAVDGPLNRAQTCIYTLSADRHFIIDRHPEYSHVAIATGFSGHGFKFASVVGEIVADLTEKGTTEWDIKRFRIGR